MSGTAVVIGYGNPLRADDGLGWQVAQQLASEIGVDGTRVIAAHQLTPELAEQLSQARLAVFVDAREGTRPGQVRCQVVRPAGEAHLSFSHDVDPPALLELARLLYGASPHAVLVTVDGEDFGYGVGLSPVISTALPNVLHMVKTIVRFGATADLTPRSTGDLTPRPPLWRGDGERDAGGAVEAFSVGGQADA
jgi:hydrogenase maturation protease